METDNCQSNNAENDHLYQQRMPFLYNAQSTKKSHGAVSFLQRIYKCHSVSIILLSSDGQIILKSKQEINTKETAGNLMVCGKFSEGFTSGR